MFGNIIQETFQNFLSEEDFTFLYSICYILCYIVYV